MAGIRAVTSAMVCPRARRRRARHPHRSTLADWILEPGRPTALEMSGHAAMARCTRARARRRRCAHQGTARTSAPMHEHLRQRGRERAEHRGDREPPAGQQDDGSGVDALGEPGQADPRAEHERARSRPGRRRRAGTAHQPGCAAWSQHPAARAAPAMAAGATSERYRHASRASSSAAGTGNGLSMTTMGCRPARRARRVCLRICR